MFIWISQRSLQSTSSIVTIPGAAEFMAYHERNAAGLLVW